MVLILDHLRSHVLESSTERISLLTVIRLNAPSEITYLNDIAFFNKNILRLDISVNQPLLMHIVDTRAYLDEEVESCVLAEVLFFPNEIE